MPGKAEKKTKCLAVFLWRRIQIPAAPAGARFQRPIEAIEYREEIRFDIGKHEKLLVQLVITAFAEPQQTILFMRESFAFDDQANRICHALR